MHKRIGSIISLFALALVCGATILFDTKNVYADYSISMTSSGAQSINVSPGASGVGTSISEDSVTITTTCPKGYNLSISTSVNDNKLYLNGDSSNNTAGTFFNPSDGNTALSSAANTWGFYQSGSSVPTSSSVFKAVPASTSAPALVRASNSTNDTFSVYYGVAVGNNLAPGSYKMINDTNNPNQSGTVQYYLTLNEECLRTYMQDVTDSDLATLMPNNGDSTTLYDKRDNNDYQITKINGDYWMTQNLRITNTTGQPTGTILAENSNFSSDLTFNGDLTSGNIYTAKRYHIPTATDLSTLGLTAKEIGVWYNYCAASAGTVCNNTTKADATEDICPANWRLPTSDEIEGVTSLANNFSPTNHGYYFSGSLTTTPAHWWAATGYSTTGQYRLTYDSGNLSTMGLNKRYGNAIRCVAEPPRTDPCNGHENELYCKVKAQSKGTQTEANLRAAIATDNSGVYEYDSSVFGTASDATNTHAIYYYRGILDNTTGAYGSDGDNTKYPNTVVLSSASSKSELTTNDTCWRIVRTTGSGGVKMIYQGKWTGSTCANSTTNAQVTTKAINDTSNISDKSIIAVGYTFNPSYKTTTGNTAYSTLFGSNTSFSGNSTASTMKTYIEDTWFSNINSYADKLEQSAGWCNDRTIRSTSSSTSVISDSTNISTPYTTASSGITIYYFGPYVRTQTANDKPTLGCPRENADLYTTSTASNGNKQLSKPAALLTADEAALAGSGYSSSTTPYHANSYLRSGSDFWVLSPYNRNSDGYARSLRVSSSGILHNYRYTSDTYGVRPTISLIPGVTPASGSGTATNPWIVNPEPNPEMQNLDSSKCVSNHSTTVIDSRDSEQYKIQRLADGKCWMLDNLRLGGDTSTNLTPSNTNINTNYTLPASTTSGFNSTLGYTHAAINTDYKNTTVTSYGSGSGKIGTYYNYCAATAGKYCYASDKGTGDATYDICPKGWRMPTGDDYGEYQVLYDAYNDATSFRNALSTPLSGVFYGGSPDGQNEVGCFWSASNYDSSSMHSLYALPNKIEPADIDTRYTGLTIRCILDQ